MKELFETVDMRQIIVFLSKTSIFIIVFNLLVLFQLLSLDFTTLLICVDPREHLLRVAKLLLSLMALKLWLNGLYCADAPLRNCSISWFEKWEGCFCVWSADTEWCHRSEVQMLIDEWKGSDKTNRPLAFIQYTHCRRMRRPRRWTTSSTHVSVVCAIVPLAGQNLPVLQMELWLIMNRRWRSTATGAWWVQADWLIAGSAVCQAAPRVPTDPKKNSRIWSSHYAWPEQSQNWKVL